MLKKRVRNDYSFLSELKISHSEIPRCRDLAELTKNRRNLRNFV